MLKKCKSSSVPKWLPITSKSFLEDAERCSDWHISKTSEHFYFLIHKNVQLRLLFHEILTIHSFHKLNKNQTDHYNRHVKFPRSYIVNRQHSVLQKIKTMAVLLWILDAWHQTPCGVWSERRNLWRRFRTNTAARLAACWSS